MSEHAEKQRAYRVWVVERQSKVLTRLTDCSYESPPHTATEARALLRVLLAREPEPGRTAWLVPVAGGSQRIEISEAS